MVVCSGGVFTGNGRWLVVIENSLLKLVIKPGVRVGAWCNFQGFLV